MSCTTILLLVYGTQSCNAQTFESSGVTLLSRLALGDFISPHSEATDIWGYVSPSGREYALLGLSDATAFVEVTDPMNPVVLDEVPNIFSCCSDIKTFGPYAYIVSEEMNVGMKIVDMTDIDSGIVTHVGTYTGAGLAQAHNIAINEDSGFAYISGAFDNPSQGGLIILDLADPTAPSFSAFWSDEFVHDLQVVTYTSGPYAGREIAFLYSGFFTPALRILDVTDKANIDQIGFTTYPNASFCHQGWLSEDKRYVYLNDEFDEIDFGLTTTTYVIDVSDLSSPTYTRSFSTGLPSTDHNIMVTGDFIYEANYTSGLRIFHAATPTFIHEVGYFDTFPPNNVPGFSGAWGVYSDLPSGNILVSDVQRGLFILDATEAQNRATPVTALTPLGLIALLATLLGATMVCSNTPRSKSSSG